MSPRKKKIVCDCLQVDEDTLLEALRARRLKRVEDITEYTEAGGGCTSCHPLLKQYLALHCR